MTKLSVTSTPTTSEPRTTATAATDFSRFSNRATFVAYRADRHRRGWFAGFRALKPFVINVPVAGTSTILIPSTTRSTTTDSAGFLERAALWTCQRADSCAGY